MGIVGKIFVFGIIPIAFLLVAIGIIVNQLAVGADNSEDEYFVLTITELHYKYSNVDVKYRYTDDDWCILVGDNEDDCDATQSKATAWLIINSLSALFAIFLYITAFLMEFGSVCFMANKLAGIITASLSGLLCLIAMIVYLADHPFLGEEFPTSGEIVAGASVWMGLTGGLLYFTVISPFVLNLFTGLEANSQPDALKGGPKIGFAPGQKFKIEAADMQKQDSIQIADASPASNMANMTELVATVSPQQLQPANSNDPPAEPLAQEPVQSPPQQVQQPQGYNTRAGPDRALDVVSGEGGAAGGGSREGANSTGGGSTSGGYGVAPTQFSVNGPGRAMGPGGSPAGGSSFGGRGGGFGGRGGYGSPAQGPGPGGYGSPQTGGYGGRGNMKY